MADKCVCTCGPKGIEFVAPSYKEFALGARLAPKKDGEAKPEKKP